MKRYIFILVVFITTHLSAQISVDSISVKKVDTSKVTTVGKKATKVVDKKNNFWSKVKFGSGFGLNFLGGTNISVSPNAIYNFDNGLAIGLGLNYAYSKVENSKSNTFGGSVLSFYTIPKSKIQFSGEYELLRSKLNNNLGETSNTSSALFLGATYNFGKIAVGFRYNLLFNDDSPYSQAFLPVVRVGF